MYSKSRPVFGRDLARTAKLCSSLTSPLPPLSLLPFLSFVSNSSVLHSIQVNSGLLFTKGMIIPNGS
jgi:hypothetical protein